MQSSLQPSRGRHFAWLSAVYSEEKKKQIAVKKEEKDTLDQILWRRGSWLIRFLNNYLPTLY